MESCSSPYSCDQDEPKISFLGACDVSLYEDVILLEAPQALGPNL